MATVTVNELEKLTVGAATDLLLATRGTVGNKMTFSDFANYVIKTYESSVSGQTQSIKSALDELYAAIGGPQVAQVAAAMTDTSKIYVYTGSETGYTKGNWYYYNGTEWVSGGVYNATAVQTDKTLSISGQPADSKETGDKINAEATARAAAIESEAAAREEAVTDLKSQIDEIIKNIISSGGMFPSTYFAIGDINSSGVVVPSVRYRVCTPDTFTVKNDMVITIDDGYILSLWLYPVGASAYVQHGSGFTIPANTDARVLIRKVSEDTSVVADVDEFVSALFLKQYDFEPHKINQLSYDIPDDRYKNIAYVDLLAEIPSIDRRSAGGVYIDYDVKFQANPYSIRMLTAEGENIDSSEIRFTLPSAFTFAGTQEFDMFVYIPDATGITNFSLRTVTGGFVKSNYPGIVNGWNHFRFFTEGAGDLDFTASATTFRVIVTHAANTAKNIYIAGLLQIKPDKANLIIVDDGPYQSFYDIAYPAFKAIDCPVTWAIDPLLLGDSADPNRQNCSQAEIDALAYDGISEFSFHNYDGTIMSTATAQEALADTLNCVRYLRKNGIEPRHIFRAAWLQNSCPNHELADLEVEASATYNGRSGITMYPFPDRYNIARFPMQGRTTALIDAIFDKLKNQHCTIFMYTHGISDDSDKNITNAILQYYVDKIETGISEGWLSATTYNRLISHYERL